jgi:fumarate reductase flavoprotein subunit
MQELNTDVIVVAGGTAGVAAALAAAEKGAKVIVFEKSGRTGGCGNMASGLFAVESRQQRQMQMGLTRDDIFRYYMDYTHWKADARLVRAFIDKSADTIEWLEKMGVEFMAIESHGVGNYYTWHVCKSTAPMGACLEMMNIMANRARSLGVQFLLKTPVKKVIREGNRVTGVIAQNSEGEEIRAVAKAVVIATGGFCNNPEMVKKYTGFVVGSELKLMPIPGLTGDGLNMAWEIGAAKSGMIMHLMQQSAMAGHAVHAAFLQPNLLVNLAGERFIDEEVITGNNMFTGNAIAMQKNRCAFAIFDEDTKKYYTDTGFFFETAYGVAQHGSHLKAVGFDAEIQEAISKGTDGLYVADSVEELCRKTGIDMAGLQKTLREYNQACDTGRDELFDRKPRYLRPVRQPALYASKFFISAFGSLGGIKINHRMEVLSTYDDVIPGLYAAGADAESIYGDTYPIMLPGSTMGFAVNSGRIAGENASEVVKNTTG